MKHILILLQILKQSNRGRIMSQEQREEFQQLHRLASYFSRDRPLCNIYELKSKLLLFMVLFRMGYHSPKIREEDRLVSLRNRILNLYNKMYQPQRDSFLVSRIVSTIHEPSPDRHSVEPDEVYDPVYFKSLRRQQSHDEGE